MRIDTYDAYDNKGKPLANPDIYIPADSPGYTGYNQGPSAVRS